MLTAKMQSKLIQIHLLQPCYKINCQRHSVILLLAQRSQLVGTVADIIPSLESEQGEQNRCDIIEWCLTFFLNHWFSQSKSSLSSLICIHKVLKLLILQLVWLNSIRKCVGLLTSKRKVLLVLNRASGCLTKSGKYLDLLYGIQLREAIATTAELAQ